MEDKDKTKQELFTEIDLLKKEVAQLNEQLYYHSQRTRDDNKQHSAGNFKY